MRAASSLVPSQRLWSALMERTSFCSSASTALARASGSVDLDALLDERRGHHEDDEEHEHHVDERRDVDLGERLAAAAAAGGHRHGVAPQLKKCRRTMLRKSFEKLVISLSSTRIFETKKL